MQISVALTGLSLPYLAKCVILETGNTIEISFSGFFRFVVANLETVVNFDTTEDDCIRSGHKAVWKYFAQFPWRGTKLSFAASETSL